MDNKHKYYPHKMYASAALTGTTLTSLSDILQNALRYTDPDERFLYHPIEKSDFAEVRYDNVLLFYVPFQPFHKHNLQ